MNVHCVAIILGLVALATADVSHLKTHHQQSSFASTNALQSDDQQQQKFIGGQAFVYNAGNDPNAKRFWWMNTESSPFTNTDTYKPIIQNPQNIGGCGGNGCSRNTQNIEHNSYQQQQQHAFPAYSQNPFLNAKSQQQFIVPSNNFYAQMQTLSGSPTEVNSLMTDTSNSNNNYRYQQTRNVPCFGASQVCAPKEACYNGFISESNLGLVQSQSNNCDSQLETCCNIQPYEQVLEQSSVCSDGNSACVSPKFCYNGYIDQSAEQKAVRSSSGLCYAPEICCRFSQRKRSPFIQDNAFAAAESTSEVLTKEGYVVNVPSNQYLPSFPERPETEFNPDSSNNDPTRLRPDRPATQPRPIPTQPQRVVPTQPPRPIPTQPPRPIPTQPPIRDVPQTQAPYRPPPTQAPRPIPTQPQRVIPQTQPPYRPVQTSPPIRDVPQPIQPRPTQAPYQPPRTERPYQQQPSQNRPQIVQQDLAQPIIPVGCPAAMNCTLIEYCSATAVISRSPIQLTQQQELFRVPMTDCIEPTTRQQGKCCRDPDYTDPWPIGQLGQYNAAELNAVFDNGAYRSDRVSSKKRQVPPRAQADFGRNPATANTNQVITRVSAPVNRQRVVPQINQSTLNQKRAIPVVPVQQPLIPQPVQATCGVRNYNTQPRGKAPLGTGFSEFTWMTMVILESKKALLCGGAIIDKNIVATSANCVNGYRHNDVLIKGGEWRLGSEEEPKPFQIVRVKKIIFHPAFQPKTLQHDIALLYLEEDLRYDTHIGPICLDETDSVPSSSDDCVTTGWGKEVLKIHLGNALMQHTPVSVLPQADCQSQLEASQLGYTDSLICGVTQQDACEVDVGSALACADSSGRYTFKGVYSSETACNSPNQVVAYTRADFQWIREVLKNPAKAAYV